MDNLVGLAILYAIGYWIYKSGKRIGSQKGYLAGRTRRRKRRRH